MATPADRGSRRGGGPKPLGRHLDGSSGRLGRILGRCRRLHQLNRILVALLPPHLQPHVRLASIGPRFWLVEAQGPAWGTRVRFQMKTLHQQLCHQLGETVPPLKLRIAPTSAPEPAPVRRAMALSIEAARALESTARAIEDGPLRAALERLARRGRN